LAHRKQQIAWIWPALLLAGLAAIVVFRVWSGWATRPMVASTDRTEGRVEGEQADLAAAGRRLRLLQARAADSCRRLADLGAEVAAKRRQVRTLGEMLDAGRLTECPGFLRDKTTVRALQKILHEAARPAQAEGGRRSRLTTTAAIARERLRAKLSALRDQLAREVADLEARAATLRQQQRLQEADLQRLRRQINRRLDGCSPSPTAPSDPASDTGPVG